MGAAVAQGAKIYFYRDGGGRCYCSMSLTSGERIFIGLTAAGLLVTELKFFGVIPFSRIARLNSQELTSLLGQLQSGAPKAEDTPLRLVTEFCARTASIEALRNKLSPFVPTALAVESI